MNWHLILSVMLSWKNGLQISVGPSAFIISISIIIIGCIMRKIHNRRTWVTNSINFSLFNGLINAEIKPNHDVIRTAFKVWIELQTRKATLPLDEDNDVILNIYNSWYSLFGVVRDLLKELPAEQVNKNKDTTELVNLLTDVLNKGLRPHLTKWHARFQKWIEKNPDDRLPPQELQKNYPQYHELIGDLKKVNTELQKFSNSLRELIYNK